MASLRTAFIECINPAANPFISIVPWFQVPICQISNSDDIKKESKGTKIAESGTSPKFPLYFQAMRNIQNANSKIIHRVLNLNIINFSQLLDNNSNDFKDCQNFVHVLQLNEDEDEEFKLSELDTVKSMSACAENSHVKTEGSYMTKERIRQDEDADFSQVQDFQASD